MRPSKFFKQILIRNVRILFGIFTIVFVYLNKVENYLQRRLIITARFNGKEKIARDKIVRSTATLE